MIKSRKLAIGRTVSMGMESACVGTWLFQVGMEIGSELMPRYRFDEVITVPDTAYRIHCSRNSIAAAVLNLGWGDGDLLLFLDADAQVDPRLVNPYFPASSQPNAAKWAKPFLTSSIEFLMSTNAGVIFSPAVTGPPDEKLNVFIESDQGYRRITHEEYIKTPPGFLKVLGGGTHLMLIDCGIFHKMKKPWFEDQFVRDVEPDRPGFTPDWLKQIEASPDIPDAAKQALDRWNPDPQLNVLKSQDAMFGLKCTQLGYPVYANLFAPSGHIKQDSFLPPLYEGKKEEKSGE